MADGPVSRIEWVENQLRQALLSGELRPGERLLTAQLSERFQVSPTPLREALHRFAGEGLVEFIPQRGARVTELSGADNTELTELRSILEPACVAHAIVHGDGAWRSTVARCSSELRQRWQDEPHNVRASEHAYQSFYGALTSTCDSLRLKRYATAVRDQDARYRIATIDGLDRGDLAAIHERLVEAALAADVGAATAAIQQELKLFSVAYESLSGGGRA
jgi:GntR family transcriptional regulator, carbon starvation induced regulator